MRLGDLLAELDEVRIHGDVDIPITGLKYDSRRVQPGDLFVAIRGFHVNGHRFIPDALQRGAVAVVAEEPPPPDVNIPWAQAADSRAALAPLAAAFYDHPARQLRVIGVTGTDGKTTTTTMISDILEAAGHRTGLITTVSFKVGERTWDNDTRQSTPEAPEVQALLRDMVDASCDYAVIESTSHGLALHRLDGCEYDVAVLTNVTHEHLDFHGTVEAYRLAKARLFEMLGESVDKGIPKVAVVNLDDPHAGMFIARAPDQVITYAREHPSAMIRARDVVASSSGLQFTADTPWGELDITLRLVGDFNVYNALAALAVGLSQGVPPDVCQDALARFQGVRGRMEIVDRGQPFTVIIDYAHTPESFKKVMGIMRPLTRGRLIAVFGSAGERDRQKRAIQGEIAGRYCDFLILTDEDPRLEDRWAILDEIAAGVERAGKREGDGYTKIPDRAEAIAEAMRRARPGDVILLLGKGHESCIIYGTEKTPWDERKAAEAALRALGYE
ncbi:MAG TPA: UDP-N-acetylmuramoyl-L-alanyl-D-glutamate--2,6-diaminopimelate ligase [Caldilineae bacterium]|nr:UDP-N-acetylmuramoyl-L-alanyl-D-glutamate--2,6-diaminopimelate ligase [Caldilineae bacterium]